MDDPLYLLMQEQITLIVLLVVGAALVVGAGLMVPAGVAAGSGGGSAAGGGGRSGASGGGGVKGRGVGGLMYSSSSDHSLVKNPRRSSAIYIYVTESMIKFLLLYFFKQSAKPLHIHIEYY